MDETTLKAHLIRDEGERLKLYKDSVGKWSIGIGRNIQDNGITHDEAMFMLQTDMARALDDCRAIFTGWESFSNNRQLALANMSFNLGRSKLLEFKRMLAAIDHQDWDWAADESLDSKWADQVGQRAERIASLLRSG